MKPYSTPCLILLLSFSFCIPISGQWVKTAGPPGIRATKFYESGNVLYVGTDALGVYKSLDHGNTWTAANTGIENKQVLSLTGDGTYLYAGTGATDTNTDGVYRSSNGGATWTPANNGIQDKSVYSLLNAAGYLFAGTIGSGVYKSSNQGLTWTNANGGALGSSFIFAMFYANDTLRVEADNYIFYTGDLGINWYIDQGSTAFYVIKNFLQKGDTVIASANGYVFVTHNGGTTWGPRITVNEDIDILGLDMRNDTIYAGHSNGVYRSVNWGQSWTNIISTGLRFGNRYNYHFKISGSNFLISFEEIGIYKSPDKGLNWTQVPLSNFEAASTIDNSILAVGNTIFAGTHNDGIYSSADSGVSWSKTGTSNPLDTLSNGIIFALLNPAPNILLAGTCGYGLYRSTDNGLTWTHITSGLPVEDGYTCINTLAQSGNNVIAATTQGLYYSGNNGLTWTGSNISGPQVFYSSGLAVNGNIATTCIFSIALGSGIFRSTNSGVTWTLVNSSILDVIAMGAGGSNHFYAGNFYNNYVSDDNGLTWDPVGPGIPIDNGAYTILAFDNYVFIGNSRGAFFSNNYGDTFSDANTGMDPYPNNSVQGLAKDGSYVYCGTFINAMWRRPLSDFGIIPVCPSVVTNTNDSGSGSLRDIIGCSVNGANITFSNLLTDQTITLTSGEITINKNLTISGPGIMDLTISGNNNSRIFHNLNGTTLGINNMALINAGAATNGGALFIEGNLILSNILLQDNFENGIPKGMTVTGSGIVRFQGNVTIRD